jgi:hypothetical protein
MRARTHRQEAMKIQILKKRAALAAAWRNENPEMSKHGWVLIYRAEVCGWTIALDQPKSWRPGVLAIGPTGTAEAIYQSSGGNDDAGATEWSAIFDPAPAEVVA